MNPNFKKHVGKLPFYVFVLGIIAAFLYVGTVANGESSGRTLAALMMLPFYIGCVVLLSLLVWFAIKIFNRFFQKN